MALAERKYTVSVVFRTSPKTVHFDDIGCLVQYAHQHKITNTDHIMEGLVYDFDSKNPIPIKEALFEKTPYQTPMASGIIARDKAGTNTRLLKEILTFYQKWP